MNPHRITRIVAVLIAAAVLFGLEYGLELQLYVALPGAMLAYVATLVGMGLMLGIDTPAK